MNNNNNVMVSGISHHHNTRNRKGDNRGSQVYDLSVDNSKGFGKSDQEDGEEYMNKGSRESEHDYEKDFDSVYEDEMYEGEYEKLERQNLKEQRVDRSKRYTLRANK